MSAGTPQRGAVYQLLGGENASYKMAPGLHDCLRKILEGQQMAPEDIECYLLKNPTWKRYDPAFKKLYCLLEQKKIDPQEASVEQVAQGLWTLHRESPSEARNAYSAMLLFPSFQMLKFHPLLSFMKKQWNRGCPKYGAFWDPQPLLGTLLQSAAPEELRKLRDRLIICCRLLCLHRGIDLSRVSRTVSFAQKTPYIRIQRKGWKVPRWEAVLSLPDCPNISPWHLMVSYVQKTAHQAPLGGPLLLTLKPPFKGLSANTINSLTKRILQEHGVPTEVWGAHSTRGAGVTLWKGLGLLAEEVCEIGQWKNLQAFQAHYLRIGAVDKAAKVAQTLVHKTSLPRSAEPDGSSTPRRWPAEGGMDPEGEAQKGS